MQTSKWVYTYASIVITCESVSKRSRTFLTVITQIRSFSNWGTSIDNFQTTKYSLERSFQKKWEYHKNIFFRNFSEKHCVLTLMGIWGNLKLLLSISRNVASDCKTISLKEQVIDFLFQRGKFFKIKLLINIWFSLFSIFTFSFFCFFCLLVCCCFLKK